MIGSSGDGYGGNGGSVVRYALFRTPAIPVYDSAGVYSDLPLYPVFLEMDITLLHWQIKQIIKKYNTGYLQIYMQNIRSLKI